MKTNGFGVVENACGGGVEVEWRWSGGGVEVEGEFRILGTLF